MKLSILYTEDTISEGPFRKLLGRISQGGLRANPKAKALQDAIERAFQETWADFHGNPRAQRRLEAYKASILQHPELKTAQDPYALAKQLFRKRGERIVGQQKDPRAAYRSLGLDPDWMTHGRT